MVRCHVKRNETAIRPLCRDVGIAEIADIRRPADRELCSADGTSAAPQLADMPPGAVQIVRAEVWPNTLCEAPALAAVEVI